MLSASLNKTFPSFLTSQLQRKGVAAHQWHSLLAEPVCAVVGRDSLDGQGVLPAGGHVATGATPTRGITVFWHDDRGYGAVGRLLCKFCMQSSGIEEGYDIVFDENACYDARQHEGLVYVNIH